MLKIKDFIILFSKQKYFNRWVIFFIDLFFSVLSTFLVFATLGNILKISLPVREFIYINLFSILCSIICFLSCQTYKGVIRHSTFTETGRIAIASFVKATLILSEISDKSNYPNQNIIPTWLFIVLNISKLLYFSSR